MANVRPTSPGLTEPTISPLEHTPAALAGAESHATNLEHEARAREVAGAPQATRLAGSNHLGRAAIVAALSSTMQARSPSATFARPRSTAPQLPQKAEPMPNRIAENRSPFRTPFNPKKYQEIFSSGIFGSTELETTLAMLKDLSPVWADMVRRFEQLRANRDTNYELSDPFGITVQNPRDLAAGEDTTSYCVRGNYERRTELARCIVLGPGVSPFVFLHELTHALPLDALSAELAALPYMSLEELGEHPDFDTVYRHLLLEAYQDEAFSTLAEILLYRDLMAAGAPSSYFDPHDNAFYKKYLAVYEQQGITGYIRSECYIGRNHRSSYNHNRIIQLAVLATLKPQILTQPGLSAVMQEQGISVSGDATGILAQMGEIDNLINNPDPQAIVAFAGRVMASGGNFGIDLDLETLITNAKEQHALVTGKRKMASASFLGEAKLVTQQVAVLAESRRRYESYRCEFEEAWKISNGDLDKFKWDDTDGLVAFFQMTARLEVSAQNSDKTSLSELRSKIRVSLGKQGFSDALLNLEEARQQGDIERVGILFPEAVAKQAYFSGNIESDIEEIKTLHIKNKPPKRQLNPSLRLMTAIIKDVNSHVDISLAAYCFCNAMWKRANDHFIKYPFQEEVKSGDATALWSFITVLAEYDTHGWIHVITDFDRLYDQNLDKAPPIVKLLDQKNKVDRKRKRSGREPMWDIDKTDSKYDVEMVMYNEMLSALQISLYHSGAAMPIHAYHVVAYNRSNREESGLRSYALDGIAHYQSSLDQLRSPKNTKPIQFPMLPDNMKSDMDLPVLCFLEASDVIIPEGIETINIAGVSKYSRGVVVHGCPEELWRAHLDLETWERGHFPDASHLYISQFMSEMGMRLSVLEIRDGSKTSIISPSSVWVATRLTRRAMRLAINYHQRDLAFTLGRSILAMLVKLEHNSADKDMKIMARECARDFEFFLQHLPVFDGTNEDDAQKKLAEIADEYANAVKLRRSGFSPLRMLDLVRDVAISPEVRTLAIKILDTAGTHIASFGPQTPQFRSGVSGFFATVHAAHLMHAQKDKLLTEFLEKILPNLNAKTHTADLSLAQRLALFDWFANIALSEETLNTVALYPGAEKTLMERSSKILAEIGASILPVDMQGKILAISKRLEYFFSREHPAILTPENTDKLAHVSSSPEYQLDLATVVPSRRTIADPNLPVVEWSPVVVRRTMPVEAATWQRIEAALKSTASEIELKVYAAYCLREIEVAAKPTLTFEKAKNAYDSFTKRYKEMAASKIKLSAALSAHTELTQLLNDQEKIELEGLAALPSIKYALDLSEAAFAQGRDLSENETAIVKAMLQAPTLSDARRKRELYIMVLSDFRYPIAIRRLAARGLGHASPRNQVLEALSLAYERESNHADEIALYDMIVAYWRRVGELPDDHGTLLLDENKFDPSGFWLDFDYVIHTNPAPPLRSARELELLALRYGAHGAAFITEAEKFVTLAIPQNANLIFYDDIDEVMPKSVEERSRLKPWFTEIKCRQSERSDRTALISLDLPPAFVKLPNEAQFLLLRFLQNLPQDQIKSLVSDMRALNSNATDAEVYCYFFERMGLVKLGQALATMVGIIPTEDRDVFARLQDQTEHSSFSEIIRTIEEDFQKPFHEIFSDFNPIPIASASMGEVYEGHLLDGTFVYVKVGPERKMEQSHQAVKTLEAVAKDYRAATASGRFHSGIDIALLIIRFTRELKMQMDFTIERSNALEFAGEGYSTTKYVPGLSGKRVLVMIPSTGKKLRSHLISDPSQRQAAATKFARDLFKMIFKDRRFHKDPHPGNELWDEITSTLTWLDWGVIGTISESDVGKIIALLMSIAFQAEAKILEAAIRNITTPTANANSTALSSSLVTLDPANNLGQKLSVILDVAGQTGFIVESSIMETLAVLLTAYSVVEDLDPGHDLSADFIAVLTS